jgi:aryl-alcohol dehydrogenase-like predicted oxidoreductase
MRYRQLGRTGFSVSDIGHGLWGMGGWTGSEDRQSLAALQRSVDLGCSFFDTAWAYGDGHSDQLLGRILKQNKDKRLYAASKVAPLNHKWPASAQDSLHDVFPRDHVIASAEKILSALGTDAIDMLQYHVWHDSWAHEAEFRETVEELKSSGKIRAFGLSLNRWEPANGLKAIRTGLVDTVQVIYNIFDQSPEDELFPLCRENKIGVIARVPLDEGSLGDKMTRETKFPKGDWRASYFNPENLNATMDRTDELRSILPGGVSLPELAFRFILSNRDVSTTIPGMRSSAHVDANLACSDAGPLSPELLSRLKRFRWDRKPQSWSA